MVPQAARELEGDIEHLEAGRTFDIGQLPVWRAQLDDHLIQCVKGSVLPCGPTDPHRGRSIFFLLSIFFFSFWLIFQSINF